MMKNRLQTIEASIAEKRTSNMSRVVSVEKSDYNSAVAAARREL